MTLAIALIVSMCSMPSPTDINAKLAELQAKNPGAKVTLRVDKKCLKTVGGK